MFNSLKRWVQDVAVDLNPSLPPLTSSTTATSSPSSSLFLPSSSRQGTSTQQYSRSLTPSNEHFTINPSSVSTMGLTRPISMDNMRGSKVTNAFVPPPPASPGELDLSHLNREEQEHIANVLRRARAVDEQQVSVPPVVVRTIQSPPASIVSASLSPSASSSSSKSTSSFSSDRAEKYKQNDKNDNIDDLEIRYNDEEHSSSPSLESTIINIHRCQVCNKEQQQKLEENVPICLQCQIDEEIAQAMQNNTIPRTSIRKSSSPVQIELNENDEDKIYDNVMRIDQESIKPDLLTEEYASHLEVPHYIDKMNDNQGQNEEKEISDDEEQQQCQLVNLESSFPVKTRSNNLTEIDENDFFYQGPSPYIAAIDNNQMLDKIEEPSLPTYKIDEYVDEDDNDERDHVKELEETIANLSRHLPVSPTQVNEMKNQAIVTNLRQPTNLSGSNIDIDSILEMEIESPSADEQFIQSSSVARTCAGASQLPLNVPITVPISFNNNRRISLSRSSGVRENLTDLLLITATTTTSSSFSSSSSSTSSTTTVPSIQESYCDDHRPLQRTASTYGKRMMLPIHRQKRNLPSVPTITNNLQLRRVNSESRFSLPAVPPTILITNGNLDDESDLLEIDLNDPIGSMNRTEHSKTETNLTSNSNPSDYNLVTLTTNEQSSSMEEIILRKKPTKQLRDQTTNTPPMSTLSSSFKTKKKLKKKGSSSPSNTNGHHINTMYASDQISSTRANSPASIITPTTTNVTRPKLQKSTSTDMLYSFPVSKLLLSHDNLNPSRRDDTDLGLHITGGHSIPNCVEVTARIEHIDTHHRNYNILKNAVQEGDEVLEVGGVSLRGKSALFVQKLMNSIQSEFEIVVRSKHIVPPVLPPIELRKTEHRKSSKHSTSKLPISHNSLMVDNSMQRRHSMDTSQLSPNSLNTNNTVVKSQSTIMSLGIDDTNPMDNARKKNVSSKERLFSVESLHRIAVTKSAEQSMKVPAQTSNPQRTDGDIYNSFEQDRKQPARRSHEKEVTPLVKQTSLNAATSENKYMNDDTISFNQPSQRPRLYEHRNSLLPNDPGLNGAGSNQNIFRQNSNESDESDNLSQYFLSPSSRKNSLLPNNGTTTTDFPHEHKSSVTSTDSAAATDASRRLQQFIRTSEDIRQPRSSIGDASMAFKKPEGRKSSTTAFGSFKFSKKKKDSPDTPNHSIELRETDYVGDIELQIGHSSEREQLVVQVIQAKNLPAKDTNGYSDPFVKVYLLPGRDQENKRRTKHVPKNLNPVWDHTVVYGNMHREELQYKMLEFTVWDYDRFKANDFIGQVTIDLKDAKVIDDKPHWYRLQALRSREEISNRGSSPRLFKMTSTDSAASSSSVFTKNNVNAQAQSGQRK
ncbi:unnamed protein product [Adineta ricciae]|uniref:C2 domain-containing protein n=2 Tax=Adineta ricciae TaxID=249248 RepID=A0A815F918_ADIRI|nr:unnamed protein product [Adineta ricciae]